MKNRVIMKTQKLLLVILGVWGMIWGTGCVNLQPKTDPTKFYVLDVPQATAESDQDRVTVGVRTLQLEDYLNRPEIIIRQGKSEIRRESLHRWAGDLKSNLTSEFGQWWRERQPGRVVYFPPWAQRVDLELQWRISQLEAWQQDGTSHAVLAVEWCWYNQNGRTPVYREIFQAAWDGADYAALVESMSELLAQAFIKIVESEPKS